MALMVDLRSKEKDVQAHAIQVPFTVREWVRFCDFIRRRGLKKGAYVRRLVVTDMDRTESGEAKAKKQGKGGAA
jgi:hypothetical protein